MKLSQAGKMAISAVFSNKLRSFLTMLGIIIGVMAVTLLISLVQGATNTVTGQLDELGGNQLIVSVTGAQKRLTLSEVESMTEEEEIRLVSPMISGNAAAKAAGNQTDVSITGITDAYEKVQGLDLICGRAINRTDNDYRLEVCVIGQTVGKDLFGSCDERLLGKSLRLSGKDYRIVGIMEEQAQTMFSDPNRTVYIPLTDAQWLLKNTRRILVTTTIKMVMKHSSQL